MKDQISRHSLSEAYKKQKDFLKDELKQKQISGYKAAVSSFNGQNNLGLIKPITGVLYKQGIINSNDTLLLKDFNSPKIETEIGYIINKKITTKITQNEVSEYVKAIMPVLEIPNITKEDADILEVIAHNGFSSHYVVGNKLSPHDIDINNCNLKLYHNEELINIGKAIDAMNDQWLTLTITINSTIDNGYSINEDDLIITGALGNIHPLKAGYYKAMYDNLGTIELNVE